MTHKEQLDSLIVFLLSKGIISRSKLAKVIGINIAEISNEIDELVNKNMEDEFRNES